MDKLKLFVIWLDGFIEACGPTLNPEQTSIVKSKLNGLFVHEAETIDVKPTLEELGNIHGFHVTTKPENIFGRDENGALYRC